MWCDVCDVCGCRRVPPPAPREIWTWSVYIDNSRKLTVCWFLVDSWCGREYSLESGRFGTQLRIYGCVSVSEILARARMGVCVCACPASCHVHVQASAHRLCLQLPPLFTEL